eukprot:gene14742-20788_t
MIKWIWRALTRAKPEENVLFFEDSKQKSCEDQAKEFAAAPLSPGAQDVESENSDVISGESGNRPNSDFEDVSSPILGTRQGSGMITPPTDLKSSRFLVEDGQTMGIPNTCARYKETAYVVPRLSPFGSIVDRALVNEKTAILSQ